MQHHTATPPTLCEALEQALTATLRTEYVDFFGTPVIMVSIPDGNAVDTGAVLISNHRSEALAIALSDYQGVMACQYPPGYDPRDPRADEPEDVTVVYETHHDGDIHTPAEAVAGLSRMAEAVHVHLTTLTEHITATGDPAQSKDSV
ncbi:hypothetical protein ABZ249_12220 [Nocardiopsis sp. NPDC006139]|uniref:hypothetical protein n=1 Tax=Nocardiopsis sp. NPDC006139 TaxID=3154578 RepID=UPI0033A3C5FC